MGFYGAYNCSGIVRQVSGFSNVSVSELGICRILDSSGFKGGKKPCLKTRETAAQLDVYEEGDAGKTRLKN